MNFIIENIGTFLSVAIGAFISIGCIAKFVFHINFNIKCNKNKKEINIKEPSVVNDENNGVAGTTKDGDVFQGSKTENTNMSGDIISGNSNTKITIGNLNITYPPDTSASEGRRGNVAPRPMQHIQKPKTSLTDYIKKSMDATDKKDDYDCLASQYNVKLTPELKLVLDIVYKKNLISFDEIKEIYNNSGLTEDEIEAELNKLAIIKKAVHSTPLKGAAWISADKAEDIQKLIDEKQIYEIIKENPEIDGLKIYIKSGLDPQKVYGYIDDLESKGFIVLANTSIIPILAAGKKWIIKK